MTKTKRVGFARENVPTTSVTLPSTSSDAFGRLRVSSPHTLIDSKQIFDNQPLYWDDSGVSGTGTTSTHSTLTAMTTMGVSLNTAGKRVRQTFQRFNYQPGKSLVAYLTGVLEITGGGSGISASMGYFDDSNGVFVQTTDGVVGMVIRSNTSGSVVDDRVVQSSWNGDKLDGTGASGHTLDPSMIQIWWCDFEWLGAGSVRTGFVINGEFIVCHTFNHSNLISTVYMSTPNLPIRYEISNDGTGAASTLGHVCSTIFIEGGLQETGHHHYATTSENYINANTVGSSYAVIGLRLKSTHLGQQVSIADISLLGTTSDDFEWIITWNPTVANAPTFTDVSNSALQYALGDTTNNPSNTTITGGHSVAGGMASSSKAGIDIGAPINNALRLGSAIDGTRDEVWLCVKPFTANADIHGGISWRELT